MYPNSVAVFHGSLVEDKIEWKKTVEKRKVLLFWLTQRDMVQIHVFAQIARNCDSKAEQKSQRHQLIIHSILQKQW